MAGDWIKLHRKLVDSELMRQPHLLRLWIYILLTANWKPSKWIVPGTLDQIMIQPGQLVTGRKSLWERLYSKERYKPMDGERAPSDRTLWRWIHYLQKTGRIHVQNLSNRASLITVCNWETYQSADDVDCPTGVQPVSNRCPTGVQPVSTLEEGKKERREERKKGEGAFAPPTLEDVRAYCESRGNDIDPEHFHAHYTMTGWKQGNGRPIKSWKAAIVTWEKREPAFRKTDKTPPEAHRANRKSPYTY